MKRGISKNAYLVIIILSFCFLLGCLPKQSNEPPSVAHVQEVFDENREDIQTIVDYLVNVKYNLVIIRDNTGVAFADGNKIQLPEEVVKTITRLFMNNSVYLISKNGNTVELSYWKGLIYDIGCSMAYSIDRKREPEVDYITEIVPLSEEGWYYCVSEYEVWRAQNQ